MKKLTAVLLLLLLILSGCSQNASTPETDTDITEVTQEQIPGFENYVGDAQLEIFRTLINANAYFVTDVFHASRLKYDENAFFKKENVKYYQVKSDKFKTYAELEESVYTIYTDEVAKKLLGNPKIYSFIDGIFCIDSSKTASNAYNYDWTDFKIQVKQASDSKCVLTVTIKDNSGAEKDIEITIVLINGNWKLNDFYY